MQKHFTNKVGSIKFKTTGVIPDQECMQKYFTEGPVVFPEAVFTSFSKAGLKYLIKEKVLRLRIQICNHCARQFYTLNYDG